MWAKEVRVAERRNVVVLGASGAGKSALLRRLSGGSYAQTGTTTRLQVVRLETTGLRVTFLDTPGSRDFWADTRLAAPMAECALLVVDSDRLVEVGTRRAWQEAERHDLPVLVFVPQPDKVRACLAALKEAFHARFVSVDDPNDPALVEDCCDLDDQLLERYLNSDPLSPQVVADVLRRGLHNRQLFGVVSGDESLLGALARLAPAPHERPPLRLRQGQESWSCDLAKESRFSAYIFKTWHDPYLGKMSLIRVFSGSCQSDEPVYNATQAANDKIGKLYDCSGCESHAVASLTAGDMGVIAKLKSARTGDTLLASSLAQQPFQLFGLDLPAPLFTVALKPATKQDDSKLSQALHKLQEEDPGLLIGVEAHTHRPLLSGLGQRHIDWVLGELLTRFGIHVSASEPCVNYLETITKTAEAQGKHKKQTGGHGQYGDVWLRLEPLPAGTGFQFESAIVGGVVPRPFVPAVEKGIRDMLEQGVLAGFPITDVKVTLYDGSHHPVDSSELSFKLASHLAFKKAFLNAQPQLLEPFLTVHITVPATTTGDVISDLNGRRGRILGIDTLAHLQVVNASVPLSELLHYSAALTAITRGQGSFEAEFSHYEPVPPQQANRIIANARIPHSA